jgi:hypothetical protein
MSSLDPLRSCSDCLLFIVYDYASAVYDVFSLFLSPSASSPSIDLSRGEVRFTRLRVPLSQCSPAKMEKKKGKDDSEKKRKVSDIDTGRSTQEH